MSFVSVSFLILFSVVLAARCTIGRSKTEKNYLAFLLAASLVFYAWHIPAYIFVILLSTCVDYAAGRYLGSGARSRARRKTALALSLVTNLGILCFFKYTNFFLGEIEALLDGAGLKTALPVLGLALPLGISFYTFQSMSYTVDVYRGACRPVKSFWPFLLYVSFFPQLVAGPIVRARDFLYQIDRKRSLHRPALYAGFYLMIRGFFLKMVLADNLGVLVDRYWARAGEPLGPSVMALIVTLLFSLQIFCDFAGYSSIARGAAYLLGFRLPVNFNSPYIANSFSEFWTRWHITLSRWLRDYLYIPLGGNRKGRGRTFINLALVMLLGGLWHGAAFTFVVWGAVHGAALIIERLLGIERALARKDKLISFCWFFVVQAVVLTAWIAFRSESLTQAWAIFRNVIHFTPGTWADFPWRTSAVLAAPIILMHARTFSSEKLRVSPPGLGERAAAAGVMLYAALTCFGVTNAFIYFQF